MTSRSLRLTLLALLVMCALACLPATSCAYGGLPAGCPKGCPVVEVVPLYESSRAIYEPTLPRHAWPYAITENLYFTQLMEIAKGMCLTAQIAENEYEISRPYIGFSIELTEFNAVRQRLNRLLTHYRLGYAPTIEDFSGVSTLSRMLHRRKQTKHGTSIESFEGSVSVSPTCRYGLL